MKAKELIKFLQTFDPETYVVIYNNEESCCEFIEEIRTWKNPCLKTRGFFFQPQPEIDEVRENGNQVIVIE